MDRAAGADHSSEPQIWDGHGAAPRAVQGRSHSRPSDFRPGRLSAPFAAARVRRNPFPLPIVGRVAGGAWLAACLVLLAALALPANAQTFEETRRSGDCRDLDLRGPSCGIGSYIDRRASGYRETGKIATASDADLWSVIFERGQTYVIEVKGAGDAGGDNGGTLPDPVVEIYELSYNYNTDRWSGTPRASNDNASVTNNNARVVYTYPDVNELQTPVGIRVSGANGAMGTYTVSVTRGFQKFALTETTDCAGDETTACSIEVGGIERGTLSSGSDNDAWAVPLEEGKTYQIDARGVDTGGGTLPDPTLKLTVVAGSILTTSSTDNDDGTGKDARVERTIGTGLGNTYYVVVHAKPTTSGGTYTLTVTDISPPLVPPGIPRSLMAAPGDGEVVLTWRTPTNLGGGPLEGFEHRHAAGTSVPSETPWVTAGNVLTATVTGLDNGTAYAFEVRAVNAAGAGDAATATAALLSETTDCIDDVFTTCTIEVGGTERGDLPAGDADYWSVTLTAERTYVFEVKGAGDADGDNGGTLPDPSAFLYETGTTLPVAGNDNIASDNKNARISYMVPTGKGGQHFVRVGRGMGAVPGTYTLTVTDITSMSQEEDSTPAAQVTETTDCSTTNLTCTFDIGDIVDGALDSSTDIDSWQVDLEAGKTYQFDVEGRDGGGGRSAVGSDNHSL